VIRRCGAASLLLGLTLLLLGCQAKHERSADVELERGAAVRSAPKKLVVLGSSTAAGGGPRDPSDAYVPRYRAYLARQFPDFELINLAVGGQTTYHVQPTGFVPPPNRPAPASGHNISRALALGPDAIVINLPSNDTAADIPAAEQLDNLERVVKLANDAHVKLWLTSTQPRNFSAAQIRVQRQLRELILSRYSPRALDFWTPFAAADGTIRADFDAGDGVHLNAAAHSVLLRIMVGAKLPELVLQDVP
jgi:lysophospholipase L1-like esterase